MLYVKSEFTNNYYALLDETTINNILSGKLTGYIIVSKEEYKENIKKLGL